MLIFRLHNWKWFHIWWWEIQSSIGWDRRTVFNED